MGLFYSFINDFISTSEMNEQVIKKPCGQPGCCSRYSHLKKQIFNPQSPLLSITIPNNSINPRHTSTELTVKNTNNSQTTSIKRNSRRTISETTTQSRSRKSKASSPPQYSLLSKDEERLLEYVLDAYITYKGSQDLMAKSLAEKLHTDIGKMKTLCRTLCQLIEIKIQ